MKIAIPQPCSEDWQKMSPVEKGRFCQNCQKTVIDFSQKSDAALRKALLKNNGELCGRFYRHQLNRPLLKPVVPSHSKTAWPWLLSTFITLPLAAQVELNANFNTKIETFAAQEKNVNQNTVEQESNRPNIILKGFVTDSLDGIGLAHALIFLPELGESTYTDSTGSFELTAPKVNIGVNLKIGISKQGYKTVYTTISQLFEVRPLQENPPSSTTVLELKTNSISLIQTHKEDFNSMVNGRILIPQNE